MGPLTQRIEQISGEMQSLHQQAAPPPLSRFHIVTRPGEVTSGVAEFGAGRPTAAPEVRKAWHHVTGSRDLRSMGPGIAWPRGGGGVISVLRPST